MSYTGQQITTRLNQQSALTKASMQYAQSSSIRHSAVEDEGQAHDTDSVLSEKIHRRKGQPRNDGTDGATVWKLIDTALYRAILLTFAADREERNFDSGSWGLLERLTVNGILCSLHAEDSFGQIQLRCNTALYSPEEMQLLRRGACLRLTCTRTRGSLL
jgi:hypothetical protein